MISNKIVSATTMIVYISQIHLHILANCSIRIRLSFNQSAFQQTETNYVTVFRMQENIHKMESHCEYSSFEGMMSV